MKKMLVRFFSLLIILLLGGQSTLYANAYENQTDNFSILKNENREIANLGTAKSTRHSIIRHILSDIEEEDLEICAIDDSESEEEKWISYKKTLEINKYYTSSYYAQANQYFCHHVKKRLSLHKQFLHFISSSRYITLRVIRL
ncbi:hypothetical protein DVK85_04695 [Flavobacterium arcticum]|uniref:Fam-a protein n=1 Tax=Flavobacterium arcticum TaxID=1784713 RepID=A0A345HAF5_9FLAO|nr:hypothetical protein [Flavobacterium arcticum]AXG73565.1 hypothetical protein DVK85_04695 [Flavobacterium arcticum]KAF2513358.1 hypothetical protein E0W72_02750 [Flavobacterium arcticum]